eukprot:gene3540-2026_t
MHQFNINLAQKHSSDFTSVHCWVRELQDDYNCILCYKPQGEAKYGLPTNDFLLGIQTEFQKDTKCKYASKLVCIDSTHSTTGKRNKRVDHLLCVLSTIARDKAHEAWEKLEKGNPSSKIRDMDKRHKTSLELALDVSNANATQWIFPSTAKENKLKKTNGYTK